MSRPGRSGAPVLAALLGSLVVTAMASAPLAQEPTVAYGAGEGAAAKLSIELCASCHGEDLAGGRSSSLLDETWSFGGSDAELAETSTTTAPRSRTAPSRRGWSRPWSSGRRRPA